MTNTAQLVGNVILSISIILFCNFCIESIKKWFKEKKIRNFGLYAILLFANIVNIVLFLNARNGNASQLLTGDSVESIMFLLFSGSSVLLLTLHSSFLYPKKWMMNIRIANVIIYGLFAMSVICGLFQKSIILKTGFFILIFGSSLSLSFLNILSTIKNGQRQEFLLEDIIQEAMIFGFIAFAAVIFVSEPLTKSSLIKMVPYCNFYMLVLNIVFIITNIIMARKEIISKESQIEENISMKEDRNVIQFSQESNRIDFSHFELTNREEEVFFLLLKGATYKEIAANLFISTSTAKTHVLNIYKKAKVKSKNELNRVCKKVVNGN